MVFPAAAGAVNVTWDNLYELVGKAYGSEVLRRLQPHREALKNTPYEQIDPEDRFSVVTRLPVEQKYEHPEFLTAERFVALQEPVSLYQARGFFYCSGALTVTL